MSIRLPAHISKLGVVVFVEPLDLFAIFPEAWFLLSIDADVRSSTVLLACFPLADILASVGPAESAMSLTLIVYELALILFLVFPD